MCLGRGYAHAAPGASEIPDFVWLSDKIGRNSAPVAPRGGLKPGLSMLILLSRRLAATRRSVKWPDLEITQTRKICFLLTFPWWPGDHPGWPGDCPGWLGDGTGRPTVYPSWPEDHPRWPEDLLGWLEDCFGWPKHCPGLPKDFPGWPKDHLD